MLLQIIANCALSVDITLILLIYSAKYLVLKRKFDVFITCDLYIMTLAPCSNKREKRSEVSNIENLARIKINYSLYPFYGHMNLTSIFK